MIAIGLRTYVRYVVPLTVLSALVSLPLGYLALSVAVPANAAQTRSVIRVAFVIAAVAWIFQLWLVGGAAPMARAVADGKPLSQLRAFGAGLVSLVRGTVPWLYAIAAIACGCFALVVPGLVAIALFSLSAASQERGVPAPLVESAAIVRQHGMLVVGVIGALVAIDIAIPVIAKLALTQPLAKKPDPELLRAYRDVVRVAAAGAIVVGPIAASILAAIHARSGQPAVERDA